MPAAVMVVIAASVLSLLIIFVAFVFVVPFVTVRQYCAKVSATEFKAIDGSEGAGSSDLHYFVLSYDCRQHDVIVRGDVPRAMHWQIGVFDGSLRLIDGGYINHHTAVIDAGKFEVVVSRHPVPGGSSIDCSASPRGLLIYRVLCALESPSKPIVEIADRRTGQTEESSWGIDR